MIADIFGLIPLVSLGLLFLIFKQIDKCWRTAILSAAVVWGSVVALSTEILSLFELLTFEWVLGLWLVADILWLIIYLKLNSVKPDIRSNDRQSVI
jgi:hypothetical protein